MSTIHNITNNIIRLVLLILCFLFNTLDKYCLCFVDISVLLEIQVLAILLIFTRKYYIRVSWQHIANTNYIS